jgi:hypothetical protein
MAELQKAYHEMWRVMRGLVDPQIGGKQGGCDRHYATGSSPIDDLAGGVHFDGEKCQTGCHVSLLALSIPHTEK